ncbi:MAG: DUF2273 domain-containing protein [Clostridia bacterium]|nr:DUF2273 domain-containing protein [Clostridia bacterium]
MRNLIEHLMNSRPGLLGAGIGLSIALLLVIFGFFKTLFILLLTFAGYVIGTLYLRDKEKLRDLLDRILPPGLFR